MVSVQLQSLLTKHQETSAEQAILQPSTSSAAKALEPGWSDVAEQVSPDTLAVQSSARRPLGPLQVFAETSVTWHGVV